MTFQPYTPEIRFADIDAMGHVNNAVYFSYFEQARIHFFRQWIGLEWNWSEHGILVAHNEIDYKVPILLSDTIAIHVGVVHMGNRSFTLSYRVEKETPDGTVLCSSGASVLVCYNHLKHETTLVPDSWKERLAALMSH
jgi:acyl-CoA thioester hydrolase